MSTESPDATRGDDGAGLIRGLRSLPGRVLCCFGYHDYQWSVTATNPKLNWEECTRCGDIDPEFEHHYEAYQEPNDGQ